MEQKVQQQVQHVTREAGCTCKKEHAAVRRRQHLHTSCMASPGAKAKNPCTVITWGTYYLASGPFQRKFAYWEPAGKSVNLFLLGTYPYSFTELLSHYVQVCL
jgi:hypothetical protein